MRNARLMSIGLAGLAATVVPVAGNVVPFNPQSIVTTGADFAAQVVLADIDRDGDLDAVVISEVDNTVAWYENTKNFASPWAQHIIGTVTDDPRGVAVGDVNGDGRPDVAVASFNDNTVRVFRSDSSPGVGLWAFDVISTTSLGAQSVALADVDHDCDLDVVVASSTDDTVSWYENANTFPASWTEHIIDSTLDGAVSVAVADLDDDGDIDVVAAGFNENQVVTYENDGTPASGWTRHLVTNLVGATRVAVGELDANGRPDIAAVSNSLGMLVRCINEGNSVWATSTLSSALVGPSGVSISDLDSNGTADILVSSSTSNTLNMFDNNGEAVTFTARVIASGGMVRPTSIVAGDIDNDGDLDVVASSSGDDKVSLFVNRSIHRSAGFGGAEVSIGINVTGGEPLVADIDGDEQMDVAARGTDGVLRWYRNNDTPATPNWVARTIASDGGSSSGAMTLLRAADIDGDGDMDIIRGCQGTFSSDYIDWIENDGNPINGGWTRHVIDGGVLDNSSVVNDIQLADMDCDGDLDIVMSRWNTVPSGSNGLYWYENQLNQVALDNWNRHDIYTDSTSNSFQLYANGIGLGDIDRDGDVDVFCSIDDESDPNVPRTLGVVWFRNDGAANPTFTKMTTVNTSGFTTGHIEVVDLDRDGIMDLVIGSNTWYHNISQFVPDLVHESYDGLYANRFHISDLDLDGDLDIFETINGATTSVVWLENVGGNPLQFTRHYVTTAGDALGAGLADFDQDGDPDAVCLFELSAAVGLRYLPNRSGHFGMEASTPFTPLIGNVIPSGTRRTQLFTVDASHLGRSGDMDEEVSALRIKWESNFAAPMTTAEFDAIFDTLTVYKDNGDGVFSTLTDSVVSSYSTVSLDVNGVSVSTLPDGGALEQLSFGAAPSRYFVAVQPRESARSQPINRFIATLLTDSGADEAAVHSDCQDRGNDAVLRIRASANAATGLITFACRGDFNMSGSVTVQDIFDFLAAYFTGSASADFNSSGTVTVQDLFDFLAAYFAGC